MTPEQINIVRLKERLEDIEYPNKDFGCVNSINVILVGFL